MMILTRKTKSQEINELVGKAIISYKDFIIRVSTISYRNYSGNIERYVPYNINSKHVHEVYLAYKQGKKMSLYQNYINLMLILEGVYTSAELFNVKETIVSSYIKEPKNFVLTQLQNLYITFLTNIRKVMTLIYKFLKRYNNLDFVIISLKHLIYELKDIEKHFTPLLHDNAYVLEASYEEVHDFISTLYRTIRRYSILLDRTLPLIKGIK